MYWQNQRLNPVKSHGEPPYSYGFSMFSHGFPRVIHLQCTGLVEAPRRPEAWPDPPTIDRASSRRWWERWGANNSWWFFSGFSWLFKCNQWWRSLPFHYDLWLIYGWSMSFYNCWIDPGESSWFISLWWINPWNYWNYYQQRIIPMELLESLWNYYQCWISEYEIYNQWWTSLPFHYDLWVIYLYFCGL